MRLQGKELTCERGGRYVFTGLCFSVETGEMLVLRGDNGSGKTSLLRLIAGLGKPAAGELTLSGGDDELSIAQQAHFAAHQDAYKPALTVGENLEFWAGFLGGGNIDEALQAFDLGFLRHSQAALLSAGQKKRLALSRLVLAPRVIWLLDEPSVGLDAGSVKRLVAVIRQQLDSGGMVIATTHIDLGVAGISELNLNDLGQRAA